MNTYRIHGDNIVECERIAHLILEEIKPKNINTMLISPSTIVLEVAFEYCGNQHEWHIELLPGFNKAGRHRWDGNIFDALKENGSFLNETPDAIITSINENTEEILCAVEFCSALQAGNQAWQRSGRAFSTGRTGCPYLYIVDFVKYELNSRTRERKALRFPNPAVPYSYINFSKNINSFVVQVYVRSEEFDKRREPLLSNFNENDFGEKELKKYIVHKMLGINTSKIETELLRKNLNVVLFLAGNSNPKTNFTTAQWESLYNSELDMIDYTVENINFNFHKTITGKGHHGKSKDVLTLIDKLSIGLASRDLPFGIIPATKRNEFANELKSLYPNFENSVLDKIAKNDKHLIICLIKGFKPKGDDNRPDRGLLPLATMLSASDVDTMTYLYGPVIYNNFTKLTNKPNRLASANGLWKSILELSNFVALDVPILEGPISDATILLDTTALKLGYTEQNNNISTLQRPAFSSTPIELHEDDVDTGIHYLFSHILNEYCFEGMCNPPGGDWSGFSIISNDDECRWLSLPRVSNDIDGKRPDHIIEIFDVFKKPLLLSIESKEKSVDLEDNVGNGLINYIKSLMNFIPSVSRKYIPQKGDWEQAKRKVNFDLFETISAAAYLRKYAQDNKTVFLNSNCEMLFILEPRENGWDIEIVPNSRKTELLKSYLLGKTYDDYITLR